MEQDRRRISQSPTRTPGASAQGAPQKPQHDAALAVAVSVDPPAASLASRDARVAQKCPLLHSGAPRTGPSTARSTTRARKPRTPPPPPRPDDRRVSRSRGAKCHRLRAYTGLAQRQRRRRAEGRHRHGGARSVTGTRAAAHGAGSHWTPNSPVRHVDAFSALK